MKTAKWWRSRHIDSWAREAKFYWKLSTHYLDLANLSQQDFNFCKLSRFPRDRQDKIKHQIWTSGFLCEYGNWMICHDAWWLFIILALLVLLSELNWFKLINWSKMLFRNSLHHQRSWVLYLQACRKQSYDQFTFWYPESAS